MGPGARQSRCSDRGSGNFPFRLFSFPAASLLSEEGFGVVVVVAWISFIRVVDLLSYPPLVGVDRRLAVVAELHVIHSHVFLLGELRFAPATYRVPFISWNFLAVRH
jgi:hypothetical protein